MSVTLSARTLPTKSQPMAEPVAGPSNALSLSGLTTREIIPRSPGLRGEHRARGAEDNIAGVRPDVEVSVLLQENLKPLDGKFPVAAALASVFAMSQRLSLPPSETGRNRSVEKMAKAKVKAWRKGKGKETMTGSMFGTT